MEDQTISRQLRWQRKKIAEGKCPCCGKANNGPGAHCPPCQEKNRKISRKRNRDAYRLKHGIPLDAPLHSRKAKSVD